MLLILSALVISCVAVFSPPAACKKTKVNKPVPVDPQSSCWMMIKTLPVYQWQSESFSRTTLNMVTGWFNGNDHIIRRLYERCVSRYQELMEQHTRNIKINNKSMDILEDQLDFMTGNSSKKMLIIMDLDETCLDQKFRKTGPWAFTPRPKDWRRLTQYISVQNIKDLNFGLHGSMSGEEVFGYLTVFRNGLMHFIHLHRKSAHIVIYQLDDPAYIITHLIQIEMYYNYVYQFAVNPKRFATRKIQKDYEMFEFDYIVDGKETLKGQVEPQKSFNSFIKLVGDIRRFDKVIIVDDKGGKGWINKVPKKLMTDERKVFAIKPTAFDIQTEIGWRIEQLMDESIKQKVNDFSLNLVSHFVYRSHWIRVNPANGSLVWAEAEMMLKLMQLADDIGIAVM